MANARQHMPTVKNISLTKAWAKGIKEIRGATLQIVHNERNFASVHALFFIQHEISKVVKIRSRPDDTISSGGDTLLPICSISLKCPTPAQIRQEIGCPE